jgi:hypothetical protein
MVGYDLISWITKIKCGQIEREKCLFRYWQPEEVGGFRHSDRHPDLQTHVVVPWKDSKKILGMVFRQLKLPSHSPQLKTLTLLRIDDRPCIRPADDRHVQ